MKRLFPFVVLLIVFAAQPARAAEAECPVEIPVGAKYLVLISFYAHDAGGTPYSTNVGEWVTGPGVVTASSEGHPTGHIWREGIMPIEECGRTSNSLFSDGFESGDSSSW